MFRFALLGLLCSLAASSTIPAGSSPVSVSASYNAQLQVEINTLTSGIEQIEETDTPTADQLKGIIGELNAPNTQLTQEQLDAKKAEAAQAITAFQAKIDQLNADATAIVAKYEGQTGPVVDEVKAAAAAIQAGTRAISSNLATQITLIQGAATQDDLKAALNAQDLYQSMVAVDQFINNSKATLNNISVPTEEVKQKLDTGLGELKDSVETAKQDLAEKTQVLEDLKKQITSSVTPAKLAELQAQIQSTIADLKAKLDETKDKANSFISELPKTIDSSTQKAIDAAKSAAENVLAKVQSVSESLTNLQNKVASAISGNDLKSKLTTVINNLKLTLSNLLQSTINALQNATDVLQRFMDVLLSGAGEFFNGIVDGFQGYVSGLTGQLPIP